MALRIGYLGAGFISGVHRNNHHADPRVEVSAIYDVEPERGGALAVASVEELFERCDAVYITSPNTTHAGYALRAIEAGKHVFCEKPMATTIEDARAVLQASRKGGVAFQVGHNRRFAKVYQRVRKFLDEHPPHCAHLKMNRGELLRPPWTGDDKVTGGFLFETPIHMFDMVRFQFGEVASVDAREGRNNDFSILFEFESGIYATFVTSADASWYFPFERLEAYGEYSTIETAEMESAAWRAGLETPTQSENFSLLGMEEKFGFREEDRRFVDAALENGEPPVTAYDGFRSVQIALAVYQSAREKRAVRLEAA